MDLANRGILGASGNPKFVAQHVPGNVGFGVILTPNNLAQLGVNTAAITSQPITTPSSVIATTQQFKTIIQETRNSLASPSDYLKALFSKLQAEGKFDGLAKGQTKQEGTLLLGITFGKELPSIQMGNIKVQLEKSGEVSAWEIGSKATPVALTEPKLQTMVDDIAAATASVHHQGPG